MPRAFSALLIDDKPLIPLPPDEFVGSWYQRFVEPRCTICTSPWRETVEHVYLASGRKPYAVHTFFMKHFGVRIYPETVGTHMEQHCDLSRLWKSGIAEIERRAEDFARFRGRELDLAIQALMVELDDIRGMDCRKNPDLKIKRAQMVDRLAVNIAKLKKERDELPVGSNVEGLLFQTLTDIINRLPHEECRQVVWTKIREVKDLLQNA